MIPLERVKVPCTGWPGTVAAGAPVQVPPTVVPAGIASGAPVSVLVAPASEHATAEAGAFPVFSSCTVHVVAAAVPLVHCRVVTVTLGVEDAKLGTVSVTVVTSPPMIMT